MITFNTQEEAIEFKNWVNMNCTMMPILTTEPVEENGKWGFETTPDLEFFYEQFQNVQ